MGSWSSARTSRRFCRTSNAGKRGPSSPPCARKTRSAPIAEAIGKMINTCLSCVPPIVQLAGAAALTHDQVERDRVMQLFREKVVLLTTGLNRIDGFRTLDPTATFYVFPN